MSRRRNISREFSYFLILKKLYDFSLINNAAESFARMGFHRPSLFTFAWFIAKMILIKNFLRLPLRFKAISQNAEISWSASVSGNSQF